MKDKRFRTFLIRGVIGGAVGGLVLAAAAVFVAQPTGWDNWVGWFLVIYAVVGLPFGVVVGSAVGTTMWVIHSRSGFHLGFLSRALIGTIIGMICWAIVWAVTYRTGYMERSWASAFLGLILFGAATGGIPGIVSGMRERLPKSYTPR